MNKKSNAISYRVWLYHVGLRHAYQSDPKEQMIGQLDFLLHNQKKLYKAAKYWGKCD